MTRKINIDMFQVTVNEMLREYGERAEEILETSSKTVAKDTVKTLKSTSPVGNRGKYKKGWGTKEIKSRHGTSQVVHNKTDYQLTHLLEYGHATLNGSRTKAIPHIAPAEETAIVEFIESVEGGIDDL